MPLKANVLKDKEIHMVDRPLYSRKSLAVIGWIAAFFPLAYPSCLNYYLPSNFLHILLILMGLSGVFFLLVSFYKFGFDKYTALIIAYCGVLVISTIYNGGNVQGSVLTSVNNSFLSLVGLTAAVSVFIKSRNIVMIDAMLRYFEILIIINLVTIILFPGGMYSTLQEENYFLGFENIHSTTYIFTLALAFVKDKLYYQTNIISTETKILLLLCNISVFITTSTATIIQFVIFDILIIFRKQFKKLRIFNAYFAVIINLLITIFLLFFYSYLSSQEWFRGFIIDILGKDMTFMARTYIWDAFMLMFIQKPILGYGVNLDSLLNMSSSYMGFGIGSSHAHNQYLTDAYYGGLIMLCLLLIIVFRLANKINSCKRDDFNWFMLVIFFLTLFHWNTESLHMPLQIATFAIINNMSLIEKRSLVIENDLHLKKQKNQLFKLKLRRTI